MPEKFDPEGSGFDRESAKRHGIKSDRTGHFPSRVPETGLILKGKKHPTFHLTEMAEQRLGFEIVKDPVSGRYFSRKKR